MPWVSESVPMKRLSFVKEALRANTNVSELCQRYGISRKTGYKWIDRFSRGGEPALRDNSKRPSRTPKRTREAIEIEVVSTREEFGWGARKIRRHLRNNGWKVPSTRTVTRILKRRGYIQADSNRPRPRLPLQDIMQPKCCNDVWTGDFKGRWKMRNGKDCEPLTLRDEYSRYILSLRAFEFSACYEEVKEAFTDAFKEFGLPRYIRSDNGQPFVTTWAFCGLTRLSVWWLKLGITPNRIPPASPHKNPGHERMHGDIAREIEKDPGLNINHEQRRLGKWGHTFNHIRPHESLGDDTPASHYVRSPRTFPRSIPEYQYPTNFDVCRVSSRGYLSWRNNKIYLSEAFSKEHVGLEVRNKKTLILWFTDYPLAVTDTSLTLPLKQNFYPGFKNYDFLKS